MRCCDRRDDRRNVTHHGAVPDIRRFLPPPLQVPGLAAVRGWRRTGRRDAVAGIAVAAYLVPQCLAYARLAGLEPVAGLWAALPALIVYAFLGSSRVLSIGPESASALLVGSAVATLTRAHDLAPATAAAALALAVAVLALVGWLALPGVPRRPPLQAGTDRLPRRRRGHDDRLATSEHHRDHLA